MVRRRGLSNYHSLRSLTGLETHDTGKGCEPLGVRLEAFTIYLPEIYSLR